MLQHTTYASEKDSFPRAKVPFSRLGGQAQGVRIPEIFGWESEAPRIQTQWGGRHKNGK